MLQVISALNGFAIEASDGRLGTVVDFLFDDSNWRVRWLVVDCGTWLRGRKVLIHPSAISGTRLEDRRFEVNLTMAQVNESPDWSLDRPVSRQMESRLFGYYGWDPLWDAPYLGGTPGAMATPLLAPPDFKFQMAEDIRLEREGTVEEDAHLRGFQEIVGYHLHASDGDIGHVENMMLDASDWSLPYFVVDTSNWWFGERVLMSVVAVTSIEWTDRRIHLDISKDQVKSSPKWDPLVAFNEFYAKTLHHHYGWPGSGG